MYIKKYQNKEKNVTPTMFLALKKSGKKSVLASEILNFKFPIDVL